MNPRPVCSPIVRVLPPVVVRLLALILAVHLATGAGAAEAAAAPPVAPTGPLPAEWATGVDPFFLQARVALPAERNGWVVWEKMPAEIVPVGEDAALREAYDAVTRPDGDYPEGPAGELLEQWLAANRNALEMLELGLGRGACQFPEVTGPEALLPYLSSYRELARQLLVRAKMRTAYGQYGEAATDLATDLEFGTVVSRGEGVLIHVLVGYAIQSLSMGGMRWFAAQRPVPAEALTPLLAALAPLEPAGLEIGQAMRTEFTGLAVPVLRRLGQAASAAEQADRFGEIMGLVGTDAPQDATGKALVAAVVRLPGALDPAETLKTISSALLTCVRSAQGPWAERQSIAAIVDPIRTEIDSRQKKVQALAEEWQKSGQPPTPEAADAAVREIVGDLHNPVGKYLLTALLPAIDKVVERSFRCRAEREATRTVVALRLFALDKKRLPGTLAELVAPGLLAAVPVDAFSGQPLHYAADKRRLWSVGPDGKDDGGSGSPDDPNKSADLIWKVPAP